MNDEFNLQRFIDAQQPMIDRVGAELRAGRKQSHWMWFVFPQLEGLGHSGMARRFAISSLAEATAYLQHPLLGARLRRHAALVAALEDRTVNEIFGSPDDLKFHSSMTLFAQAAPDEMVFRECLHKYFADMPDPLTLARLDM